MNTQHTDSNSSTKMHALKKLGFNSTVEAHMNEGKYAPFSIGRIALEHKERYVVRTANGDFNAEIVGNLRFSAQSRMDFPAVGDWVAVSEYDEHSVLIHAIYPRWSTIKRKSIGKSTEQLVACNVDFAFIVQAVNRDFSLNRIERYLTICQDSAIQPIVIISKVDLIEEEELNNLLASVRKRIPNTTVHAISNKNRTGIEELKSMIIEGKTYCVLGSSGVGKSTLINSISEEKVQKTGEISEQTDRGKHVTSFRELIALKNGGIIIDTPGMREVGITEMSDGIAHTFSSINQLSAQCRYKDCTHIHEQGCAVIKAVEEGEIDAEMYNNYLKLVREQSHFEASSLDKKRKEKGLSKIIKNMKKDKKNGKW